MTHMHEHRARSSNESAQGLVPFCRHLSPLDCVCECVLTADTHTHHRFNKLTAPSGLSLITPITPRHYSYHPEHSKGTLIITLSDHQRLHEKCTHSHLIQNGSLMINPALDGTPKSTCFTLANTRGLKWSLTEK